MAALVPDRSKRPQFQRTQEIGVFARRTSATLWPNGAIGPNMNFGHITDRATLDHFDRFHGVPSSLETLIAHLGDHTCLFPLFSRIRRASRIDQVIGF